MRFRQFFEEAMETFENNEKLITEGLITSYPFTNVIWMLNHKYKNIITQMKPEPIPSTKGNNKTSCISIFVDRSIYNQKLIQDINEDLKVYGYFITFDDSKLNNRDVGIFIEPRFPFEIEKRYLKNNKVYHTTHKNNLNKIQKIGLTPRDSQTRFNHDGNRIYLMITNNSTIMQGMKSMIARNKKRNPIDMVVLEIDPTGLDLYIDPNFQDTQNYTSTFTFRNIPPDKIKVTTI